MEICEKEFCTGCGACAFVCPKQCITMTEDVAGVLYPCVNETECIQCGRCTKLCPAHFSWDFTSPKTAYAAWSTDAQQRRTAASGGIATELYRYAKEQNMEIIGAVLQDDFSVLMELAHTDAEREKFKNSKYVFSTAYRLYSQLKKEVEANKNILMIGLPCQIAAVRRLFPNAENLYLVDVVCHGTTPTSYLKQHIGSLEKKCADKATALSFRDATFGTARFTFSLYNKDGQRFYAQRTKDGDTYQIGYHGMISYRENCYHCQYARKERISDLTLSDYKGLGTREAWNEKTEEVSCILVHTKRGAQMVEALLHEKRIVAFPRSLAEPIQADPQLQHPSEKSKSRLDFEKEIQLCKGDFEKAMQAVIRKKRIRDFTLNKYYRMKQLIKRILRYSNQK